ncbi:hypothetical protein ACP70R_031518 [Stipagrostis hirtigluma subsp. patula]
MDARDAGSLPGEQESKSMVALDPAAASSPASDWSQLPADLLVSAFVRLDVLDLLAAGAVCRSWRVNHRAALRLGRHGRKNQSPCLLYASGDHSPSEATLRSLSTGRLCRIGLPDPPLRRRFVVGCSHGWLATADERSHLLLVNPITGAQVALPPPLTMKNVRGRYTTEAILEGYHVLELDLDARDCNMQAEPFNPTLEDGSFYFYSRVAMSADPSSGNCIVMIMHVPGNYLSFARVGDTHWTWIDIDEKCCLYHDMFYNDDDGLFYAIRNFGEVHTIDLNGPSPVMKVILKCPVRSDYRKYIVQAPWGDILHVWRHERRIKGAEYRAAKLKVYMMDLAEQKLVEMKNLQGHALFIGLNSSFFVSARDYPFLMPNCIYLTDHMYFIHDYRVGSRQLVVFNMEDGSFTDLFPDSNSWLNGSIPVWIRPSYTHDNRCQHVQIQSNVS